MPDEDAGAARVWATPPGVRLLALDEVADGAARGFVVQMRAGRFHGFVIRRGSDVVGYQDRCPHTGATLARRLDDYLSPDGGSIVCAWHGAVFAIPDGRCLGGPCVGAPLPGWPVAVSDGWIVTA